jgi:RNA polymerase sigma-70 factor (ECF subfamily)
MELVMSGRRGLVSEHYREVFRFVRRRVGSVEDAEDLTQEVFANAAAALGRSADDGAGPTLGWLYTVARRRIVDEARRRARTRTVPLELVEDPAVQGDGYGDLVARSFDAALASMPEGQRDVVLGRLIQGRSFPELAGELGISEEACRMRFMRGLQHLREEFEKEGLTP